MKFIEEIKALVGIKAEDQTEDAPMAEPTKDTEKETSVSDEDKTAIVAEVMQILEPRMLAIEERLTAIEAAMTATTEQAEQAIKVAGEAKEGVTIIAKATGSKYVAPVAAAASEEVRPSRIRTKNL